MNKPAYIFLIFLLIGCQDRQRELNWNEEEGYRWADVQLSYFGGTGFNKLNSSKTNVSFELFLTPEEIRENQMLLNGSGVTIADVDGDGLADIYFGQLNGPNKLFKNLGNFQFQDITEEAGVAHEEYYTTGVLFSDITGNGFTDLLVNTMEGPIGVYLNDGTGTFTQVENSGLGEGDGGSTLTMADINGNGLPDLFIANNKKKRVYDIFTADELKMSNIVDRAKSREGQYIFREPYDQYYKIIYRGSETDKLAELGTKNKLFINEGNGRFRDVTNEDGRFTDRNGAPYEHRAEWSLTAHFQDINGDGLPDLYVCNDYFDPDRIWINTGNGNFKEIDENRISNFSYSSMGVDISDINRDGYPDIFVTEMLSQKHSRRASQQKSEELMSEKIFDSEYQPQYMRNSMYLNRGDYTYAEISYLSGLAASEWSWATKFMDVDLDGYEDLIVNTGFAYDSIDLDFFYESDRDKSSIDLDKTPELNLKNKIFRNNQDLTFTDVGEKWGFTTEDVSYGMALADLNNNGVLDLVTSRFKSEAAIYENKINAPRIGIRLKGREENSLIIGAKVIVEGGPVKQYKKYVSGGDYLSGSAPHFAFAASPENQNHIIIVEWPNGGQSRINSVRANRIYEIYEPEIKSESGISLQEDSLEADEAENGTIFKDISDRILHTHYEETYNELEIQPLLPVKLSRLGPGISWIDYNGDGYDDLFIPSGRGGELSIFKNLGDGNFQPDTLGFLTNKTPSDQTMILGWEDEDGILLALGNSNYETRNPNTPAALTFLVSNEKITAIDSISGTYSSTGPIAAADYNGDGTLDLFIGGRFVPARYPANATSRLMKWEADRFVQDSVNAEIFEDIGLVTGAVFTDFNNNGNPDLILSREWDSLLLLENENGVFRDVTAEYGLNRYKGWWNGVTVGDFNNNGLPDIVATNWGLNSPYQLDSGNPLRMYYQDFNWNGHIDILESYYDPEMGAYVPRRQMDHYSPLSYILLQDVDRYEQFARSSLRELLNTDLNLIPLKEINTLAHTIFLNRGDSFEARQFPVEAQFSTAFSAVILDYNNDGNEDLFLTQNYFGTPPDVPRLDAGRGLLLEGNGTGQFKTVPGQISGIKIYGEQRGAAISDFNDDGKVDLAVGQNNAETKLYINQTLRRGIAVTLRGAAENRMAVGSKVWLKYENESRGPAREIHAGSGYWSQNSYKQILGVAKGKTVISIEIQWNDGSRHSIDISEDKWKYEISKD